MTFQGNFSVCQLLLFAEHGISDETLDLQYARRQVFSGLKRQVTSYSWVSESLKVQSLDGRSQGGRQSRKFTVGVHGCPFLSSMAKAEGGNRGLAGE